jgi:fibronectin type 3 domain-containing protein
MHRSIHQGATRTVLLAVLLQGLVTACDVTAPVDPKTSKGLAPTDASLTATASGLSATPVSWSEIDISWANSTSASGYEVLRSTNGATGTYVVITTTGANVRSYANTGLTGSTAYCYEVRSFKNAGKNINYSAFMGPVCATTLPPPVVAPSETDAVPQANRVQIRWKDNSSDEDGFHVEQAPVATGPWTQAVNAPANATSADVYTGTEHPTCFRVIAFNGVGPSLPSTPDCTTLPAAPTNLSAKVLDLQSITLSWTDNSAAEDGYRVTRVDAAGNEAIIANLATNATSYRDAAAVMDAVYRYRVQAIKDGGVSQFSNDARAVIPTTVPATPTHAYAWFYHEPHDPYDYGWVSFGVAWTRDPSTNAEGFRIEYSPNRAGNWSTYTTADADAWYIWQYFPVYDVGAPSGCYQVVAFNARGDSQPSNMGCAELDGAPTDLVATAVDQQSIDLTWTDNATLETGYAVIRATAIDGDYSVVTCLPATPTSCHDTGLVSGQEYWYQVAAVYDEYSWSDYSNYASATPGSGTLGALSSPKVVTGRAAPTRPVRGKPVPLHVPPRPNLVRTR